MAKSFDYFHHNASISGYLTVTFHILFAGEDLLEVLG
jgi:hypothetical protein